MRGRAGLRVNSGTYLGEPKGCQACPGSSGLAPDSLDGSFEDWWPLRPPTSCSCSLIILWNLLLLMIQNSLVLSSKLRAYMSQGQAGILGSGARPPSRPYKTDTKSCYPDEAAESKAMGFTEWLLKRLFS